MGKTAKNMTGATPPVRRIEDDDTTLVPPILLKPLSEKDTMRLATVSRPVPRKLIEDTVRSLILDENVPLYVATVTGELAYANQGYRDLVQLHEPATDRDAARRQNLPASLRAIMDEVQLIRRSITVEERFHVGAVVKSFRSRHFPIADEAGVIVAVGGTYLDCSQQAETLGRYDAEQERVADFARASSDWFWETDSEGRFTYLSDRLTSMLELPAALFLGKTLSEAGAFAAGEAGRRGAQRAMTDRVAFRDQLFRMASPHGQDKLFQISGVPLFDKITGKFRGYRGAGIDVTARVRAEAEARETRQKLEDTVEALNNKNTELEIARGKLETSIEAKNDFLAAMSHELRTPLNAIIGFAEVMNMEVFGQLPQQYKTYSHDIIKAGRHLLGLISDILDGIGVENGNVAIHPAPVVIREVVAEALALVALRAEKKNLDMSRVKVNGGWTVMADSTRVLQILVNLLSNAVKFTPEGGQIGVHVATGLDNKLLLTVWDTGIGIPADKLEVVFQKFEQMNDNVYVQQTEGTGLGLHISRELARLMGGDVSLTSVPGKGSKFTLSLPLATD